MLNRRIKLDFEARQQVNDLLEDVIDDPDAAAMEIIGLRAAIDNLNVQAVRDIVPGWVSVSVVEWDSIMTPNAK